MSKRGRQAPGAEVEDFIPWVSPISSRPLAREEEEEEENEDEMVDLVHNFAARKRKQGANYERVADTLTKVTGEVSQPLSIGPSEEQAIVAPDSPDMGFQGQPSSETVPSMDSGKVSSTVFHFQAASKLANLVEAGRISPAPREI